MKIIISILSAAVVFLAIWNYGPSVNHNRMKQYIALHVEACGAGQKQATASGDIEATIKSMADSTEKVWGELAEIKSNDLVFLGESIITIRKDLANLLERQDKIAKEQGAYFEENFMELSEIVMTNQKRILKLYETGSY